jgi:hypothetical protein
MRNRLVLTTVILTCLTSQAIAEERTDDEAEAGPQTAAEYALESGEVFAVRGEERTALELPAEAVAILVRGDELYVALGADGAALYDVSDPDAPTLVRRVDPGREQVTGFIVVDDEVWMRLVSTSAAPVDQGVPVGVGSTVVTAAKPVEDEPDEDEGEDLGSAVKGPVSIVAVRPGEVKLDAGTEDGVEVGDRFSVFRTIEVEDEVDGEGAFEGRELAGVIEVVAVSEDSALAEIWRGDRVTMEDEVQPAEEDHETSLPFPRRLDQLAEVSFVLRPILSVDSEGVGGLFDMSFTYMGSAWFAGLAVQPAGFGFTSAGNLFTGIAVAEGGYDGRWFGMGIGAGVAGYGAKADKGWKEDEFGFVLSQVFRLGPRDGLNLTGRNTLINFEWGGAHGAIDIPLTGHTTLFLEGGGSIMGYGMGALGVFTWLKGSGDAGSVGLSASAGFAAVWVGRDYEDEGLQEPEEEDGDDITALGPMVSIGIDYRFGF